MDLVFNQEGKYAPGEERRTVLAPGRKNMDISAENEGPKNFGAVRNEKPEKYLPGSVRISTTAVERAHFPSDSPAGYKRFTVSIMQPV